MWMIWSYCNYKVIHGWSLQNHQTQIDRQTERLSGCRQVVHVAPGQCPSNDRISFHLKCGKNFPTVNVSSAVKQGEPGPILQIQDHSHLFSLVIIDGHWWLLISNNVNQFFRLSITRTFSAFVKFTTSSSNLTNFYQY